MAVTIHNEPQDYTPSDNPVRWTFSSDQTTEANFYFEVTVKINGTAVKEEQVFPENGIYAHYDASAWANNACSIPVLSSDLDADASNTCTVALTVTERYGDPIADGASANTSTVNCWKARMTDEDWISWVATDYIYDGVATGKYWLTPFPTALNPKVRVDEYIRLMCINDGNALNITVTLYDSAGASITSASYTTSSAPSITTLNLSPPVLISDTAIITADFASCAYYVVSEDSSRFEDYRIDIDTDCYYDRYKRIHFLTLWGSIEALSFNLISRRSASIKSYSSKQYWGEWDSADFNYSLEEGQNIDHAKTIDRTLEIHSDWLLEEVQNWLVENCYSSPMVLTEETGGLLYRRKITNSGYQEKIQENDALFKEIVVLELTTYTGITA